MAGIVTAVSVSATNTFSKPTCDAIQLLEGLDVEGDAHLWAKPSNIAHVSPAIPPNPIRDRST